MLLTAEEFIYLALAFFAIATLYSSVGFGGGSSYLAILALVFTSFFAIRSTALLCNLIVVSSSTYFYYKKGYLDIKKFLPFIITSIPLAFIGANFKLKEQVFFIILGASLIVSAIALVVQTYKKVNTNEVAKNYPPYITYILGAGIGLLSGLVGIGGGIFLAPVLNHMLWDKPIKIAALASFFILVNSISGLAGLAISNTLQFPWVETLGLLITVFLGGQLGIRISLTKFTGNSIKVITAVLILVVGIRILMKYVV